MTKTIKELRKEIKRLEKDKDYYDSYPILQSQLQAKEECLKMIDEEFAKTYHRCFENGICGGTYIGKDEIIKLKQSIHNKIEGESK